MTRLVAGVAGGRRLAVPAGRGTRPTSERTREGLFSTLVTMCGSLDGAAFLDLYAGSGAVGLEAASRGAAHVLLVENNTAALRTLRDNVRQLGLPGVEVRAAPVARVLAEPPVSPYPVVFLDPPYAEPVEPALRLLGANGWLSPEAVVVVERATRSGAPGWPEGIGTDRSRRYGDSTLWYGRRP